MSADKIAKDARLKILRTYEVPRVALRKFRGEKEPEPTILNVYGEFGPLLVTRNKNLDGDEFNITHEATGCKFGTFKTLSAAKACARELQGLACWSITEPLVVAADATAEQRIESLARIIVEAGRKDVVPVLRRYVGR